MPDYTPTKLNPDQVKAFFDGAIPQSARSVLGLQTQFAGARGHLATLATGIAAALPEGLTAEQRDEQVKAATQQADGSCLNLWIELQRAQAAHAALLAERDRLAPKAPTTPAAPSA